MEYGGLMICFMICRPSTSLADAPGPFSTRPSSVLSPFPCIRSFFSLLILLSLSPNAGYTGPQWKEPCVDNRRFCGPGSA